MAVDYAESLKAADLKSFGLSATYDDKPLPTRHNPVLGIVAQVMKP
jgi:hypothetical protein